MNERYSKIIEKYERWFPSLYNKTIECIPRSKYSILVYLNDNTILEFSALDNTIRDVTKLYDENSEVHTNEEEWRKEFGRRLRTALAEKAMSQEELSDLSGISRQMITRYVRGHSTPSAYIIDKLARILSCDVRDLTQFSYVDR